MNFILKRGFLVKRIDETESANAFVQRVSAGFYNFERCVNNEVDYQKEKEERDTNAVKEFANTSVFSKLKEMI